MMLDPVDQFRIAAIVAITLVAAILDLRTRKLPNWLTVPACLAAFVFHVTTGGFYGLLNSLGGFATGFSILLVLWLIGGGGAGDVKLMGAVGAWLGAKYTLYTFLLSAGFAVFGSVLLICLMVARNGVSKVRHRYFNRKHDKNFETTKNHGHSAHRRIMPYALPLALGTWLVLAWQIILQKH